MGCSFCVYCSCYLCMLFCWSRPILALNTIYISMYISIPVLSPDLHTWGLSAIFTWILYLVIYLITLSPRSALWNCLLILVVGLWKLYFPDSLAADFLLVSQMESWEGVKRWVWPHALGPPFISAAVCQAVLFTLTVLRLKACHCLSSLLPQGSLPSQRTCVARVQVQHRISGESTRLQKTPSQWDWLNTPGSCL